ncbi:MAG: DUF2779 domain-containing protein [Brevefilum sp.]
MLSKTDFLWYLDAPMHLWARAHDQLEEESPSLYEQHLITQGQQVESLAYQYLEEFILPEYEQGDLIWQRTYNDGKYKIRVDALIHDQQADAYDLYEIKSSTSVKKDAEMDVAFQVLLLEELLPLRKSYLLHINKGYQHGSLLDLSKFFVLEEVSERVENRRETVDAAREEAYAITRMPSPAPDFACSKPQSCPCPDLCHPGLPERPIYDIPRIGKKAVQLREMGITAIEDIPTTFDLNIKQRKHIQAAITGQPVIDKPAVQESLEALRYPLYFLDYETFNPAVPLFRDYRPYEHIVFQYSLFVIDKPGGDAEYFECLLTEPEDPAPKIVPHLLSNLGSEGSVVVWNQVFEAYRNKDLAIHCPEYAERLLGINDRLYDLMKIFTDGHYVHPDFHGSASLKAVLPVLCPDLRYEDLKIRQGEEAMLTWYWIVSGQISEAEKPEYESAMKAYCRLDTYGMIEVLNQLRKIIRS